MNNPNITGNTFWSPLGVSLVVLLIGNILTWLQNYIAKKSEIRNKRLSFIDLFNLEVNKLSSTLDSLIVDLDDKTYFAYKNINNASSTFPILQRMTEEVVVFSSDDLRQQIISTVDLASTLINDIRVLEDFFNAKKGEYSNIEAEARKEMQDLKIQLLKMDIVLDENNKPTPLGGGSSKQEKIDYAARLISEINAALSSAKNILDINTNFSKEKRAILVARILDVKAKLRELLTTMENLRIELVKSKWRL